MFDPSEPDGEYELSLQDPYQFVCATGITTLIAHAAVQFVAEQLVQAICGRDDHTVTGLVFAIHGQVSPLTVREA